MMFASILSAPTPASHSTGNVGAFDSAILADGVHDFIFRRQALGGKSFTENAQHADSMFMFIFWLSTVIFVIMMIVMVYWVLKYRRRPGTIALASPSHSTPLELAWSIIPLGFFAYMFFEGFHGYISKLVMPSDGIEMQLTGRKWSWGVVYPNGAETPEQADLGSGIKVPVFYVPEDRPVKFRMISTDVLHSFWIPDFRVKMDVIPNRYTSYWFQAEKIDDARKTGSLDNGNPYRDHFIFCAEYCGDLHSEMAAVLRVVRESDYNAIIAKWNDNVDPVELGRRQWASKCASCHTVDGAKGTGPTWKGLFGKQHSFADGSTYTSEQMGDSEFFANYIRESILYPAKKIVAGYPNQMNSFQGQLSEAQLNGIIEYIKTLK